MYVGQHTESSRLVPRMAAPPPLQQIPQSYLDSSLNGFRLQASGEDASPTPTLHDPPLAGNGLAEDAKRERPREASTLVPPRVDIRVQKAQEEKKGGTHAEQKPLPTILNTNQRHARNKEFVSYIREQMIKEYGFDLEEKASAPEKPTMKQDLETMK